MTILEYLTNNFKICWKADADAKIPSFNERKINVFKFNEDKEEPLRDKWTNININNDQIYINWECQEQWYTDLTGMKKEITRWAKYWITNYLRSNTSEVDKVKIFVKVEDRDGFKNDDFMINITPKKV